MKRRTVDQQATGKGVVIVTRSGNVVSLPRKDVGKDGRESVIITDFSTVDPCPRCGTEPRYDGALPSAGGILRVYAIHGGIWTAYAGACDCVFGAWRTVERRTSEGIIPAMRYVDDLPGIPPGLSNDEWTLLYLYKQAGDGYHQAATRVPGSIPGASRIARLVRAWMPGLESLPQPEAEQAVASKDGSGTREITQFELTDREPVMADGGRDA